VKASHYTTPRTLEDCQFALNADPIEPYEQQDGMSKKGVIVVLALSVVLSSVLLFMVNV